MEGGRRVRAVDVLELVPPLEAAPPRSLQLPALEREARAVGTLAAGVGLARRVVLVVVVPAAAPPLVAFIDRHLGVGASLGPLVDGVVGVAHVAVGAHPRGRGRGHLQHDRPDHQPHQHEPSHDAPPISKRWTRTPSEEEASWYRLPSAPSPEPGQRRRPGERPNGDREGGHGPVRRDPDHEVLVGGIGPLAPTRTTTRYPPSSVAWARASSPTCSPNRSSTASTTRPADTRPSRTASSWGRTTDRSSRPSSSGSPVVGVASAGIHHRPGVERQELGDDPIPHRTKLGREPLADHDRGPEGDPLDQRSARWPAPPNRPERMRHSPDAVTAMSVGASASRAVSRIEPPGAEHRQPALQTVQEKDAPRGVDVERGRAGRERLAARARTPPAEDRSPTAGRARSRRTRWSRTARPGHGGGAASVT